MDLATGSLVLKGAHVLDPEQGIDRIADVHLADGKIQFVGSRELPPNTKMVDLSGHYISACWIDIHVHASGTLGFASSDTFCVLHRLRRLSTADVSCNRQIVETL